MRKRVLSSALLSLLVSLAPCGPAAYAASSSDQRMVGIVAARVFAEAAPIEGWAWPPLVAISDREDVNAFATIYDVKPGETPDVKDEGNLVWVKLPTLMPAEGDDALTAEDADSSDDGGDPQQSSVVKQGDADAGEHAVAEHEDGTVTQPIIVLYQGFLDKVVLGNPDRLAAVFGHETAHILLRHVDNAPLRAPLLANMITRQQEADADVLGMKLGLSAGFPYNGLVAGILGMRDQGNYNSFEGLNASHPGWTDRVAMIDDRQSELWQSISAFENGVYFLTMEHYVLAEKCFEKVTKDCPKCYEAWANLGYAKLMRYCDGLEPEDLRTFDIGQLVVGGFYRRPLSLEPPVRGIDRELWFDAVGALRQAIILKPELVLPKANLAVAYLIGPDGKDVGQAEQLFTQVVDALKSGAVEEMEPLVRASLLVNAGVAELESGDPKAAEALFAEAQTLFAKDEDSGGGNALASALHYNRGRMYAAAAEREQRKSAIDELEAYLTSSSPAANWWPLAYEQYVNLCEDHGVDPKERETLSIAANTQYRLVTGISLPNGAMLTLNDPLASVQSALGEGRRQEVVSQPRIARYQYHDVGMEVLSTTHIVAIRLRGTKAPPLVVRASGTGGESHEIRPGMTVADLDALLGGDADKWDERLGATAQVTYRFYSRLGFGVRLAGDKIVEIIVAQIPIEAKRS